MLMQEVETVPAELAETVDRLENWGRWAVERGKRGRAASAEGRYRPRWGNNESADDELERARRGGIPPIDPHDALVVGRCLAPAGGFPYRWFMMLRLRYFARARREVICRKMGIRLESYPGELNRSLYAARNVLTRRKG